MSTTLNYDDEIMTDYSNGFGSRFNIRIYPRKRTYLEILNESKQTLISSRIDNYKLLNKNRKSLENNFKEPIFNRNVENVNALIKKNELFDMNVIKKNLIVKKKLEYDEEKERKFVENYYRIKNAELNRLRFGTE